MKKIAIVINHFQISDGVCKTAITLANSLAKYYDFEVTIIPIFKYNPKLKDSLNDNVFVRPFLKIYFRGLGKIIGILPKRLLYRILIRKKYDIEIGYCMTLPIKIIANSKNLGAKHFCWMHGYDDGLTLKKYYLKYDKLICVSKHNSIRAKKEFSEYSNNIIFAHNLVDENLIINKSHEECAIPKKNEYPVLVSVGRQSSEKGFGRLLLILSELKKMNFRFNLWLIGSGPEHHNLLKMVETLNLQDDVFLLGEKKNPHCFTAKADLFVCSSFSEGYSTTCLEACVLGIPVLSTDVSGAKEIIDEAHAGMVVGLDDESLKKGIIEILKNPCIIAKWKDTLKMTKENFYISNRIPYFVKILDSEKKK